MIFDLGDQVHYTIERLIDPFGHHIHGIFCFGESSAHGKIATGYLLEHLGKILYLLLQLLFGFTFPEICLLKALFRLYFGGQIADDLKRAQGLS